MEQTREDFIRELTAENGDKTPPIVTPRAEVVSEPLTYREDTRYSYFQDRLKMGKDRDARARILRHGQEMAALPAETRTLPEGMEVRVNPSRTDKQGGFFTPPRWLVDQAATAPRFNRVLTLLTPTFPLPPGASEISIPALTTGTKVEPDADNSANVSQDFVDARVSSPVVSVAGMSDVSLQWLEQAPPGAHVDAFVFKDLEEAFNASVAEQVFTGRESPEGGPFQQFTGILNLTGTNKITYTDGAPSGVKMFKALGEAYAEIGKKRFMPPEAWLISTARWAWLCTSEDTANRPLVLASNSDTSTFPVGSLFGTPVYLADSIPVNLGAAKNQDTIFCVRPKDYAMFESEPKLAVMEDVLSGTLQVRLVMNRYMAFLAGKYPTGISFLEGTGMIPQSGF